MEDIGNREDVGMYGKWSVKGVHEGTYIQYMEYRGRLRMCLHMEYRGHLRNTYAHGV